MNGDAGTADPGVAVFAEAAGGKKGGGWIIVASIAGTVTVLASAIAVLRSPGRS